ncbi:MAG: glycosyltransferase [Candidatus Omnitrophota bacterium]|nr:MAG: glycosyltransferase [Candidatus Omnitrophota bacterium]
MRILFLTIGDETIASSRVRVYGYLPFLAGEGIGYRILIFTSKAKCRRILTLKKDNFLQHIFEIFYKIYIIAKLLVLSKKYEIVYVQKVILPKALWKILRKLNKRVIFDFDDAIYIYKDISYLLKDAACVVVSNKILKERALGYNKRIYELISPVSVNKRFPAPKDGSVTLGWIGSPETSRYLLPLMPVFRDLKEKFENLEIEFMGVAPNKDFALLNIGIKDWSLEAEKEYLKRLAVGIMPLKDDEWSRSKAGYKLLLYMSRGIACVASPVGINMKIIENGKSGFFATSKDEWFERLSVLLKDAKLRGKIAERGRIRAKEHFSYDKVFPKFLEILYLTENST